jgi:hypothetical protein
MGDFSLRVRLAHIASINALATLPVQAGVPFLSISGSDFMEMFVGVGPARVRYAAMNILN